MKVTFFGGVGGGEVSDRSHRQVYRVKGVTLFRLTKLSQGQISAPLSVYRLFTRFFTGSKKALFYNLHFVYSILAPFIYMLFTFVCTSEGATIEEYRDLASELKILMHVGVHTNIVNLLGACIKRDGILVILEYAPHGSLLKFLRGKRDVYEATWSTTTSDPEIRLDISNLVGYAFQISRGMEYLASKKVKD